MGEHIKMCIARWLQVISIKVISIFSNIYIGEIKKANLFYATNNVFKVPNHLMSLLL